jgi:hypothetical protein
MIGRRRRRTPDLIALRVLLLGRYASEPAFVAWRDTLLGAGIPFDAIALDQAPPPASMADREGNVHYQAVIQAADGIVDAALDRAGRAALVKAERDQGVRRLTAYAYPGPLHGMKVPHRSGLLEDVGASLTSRGHELFGYLRGPVPIDPETWGYLSKAAPGEEFETLLAGSDGSALLGVYRHPDGREHMVQTFDANSAQAHGHMLRPGQLAWLTRGIYVGYRRNFLSLQVDDLLLSNHGWDDGRHATDTSENARIRMTGEDASRAALWSRERGIRLDLVCNGVGPRRARPPDQAEGRDPLLEALLREREAFGWINHTYEHLNLDEASGPTIEAEIQRNRQWAHSVGIEFEPSSLVTGEHTGLGNLTATPPRPQNPHLAPALRAQRVRFIACDASRPYPRPTAPDGRWVAPGTPFVVGTAFAVPRHPTMLAHDVSTERQALDRVRAHWPGKGEPPRSWAVAVANEAQRILVRTLSNDPRPHYFHQSNLIATNGRGESLLSQLLDVLLSLYRSLIGPSAPVAQPTLTEIGRSMLRMEAWRRVLAAGSVEAFRVGPEVELRNHTSASLEVPLTGTPVGEDYAGLRSGWVRVAPGVTRVAALGLGSRP